MSAIPFPHSIETERAVLSCFMQESDAVGCVCSQRKVEPTSFYLTAHCVIFEKLHLLWSEARPIDFVTLATALGGRLEEVGGAAYLQELWFHIPNAVNVGAYLDDLQSFWTRREIIGMCEKASKTARMGEESPVDVMGGILARAAEINAPSVKRAPTMRELTMEKLKRMQNGDVRTDILRTGLDKLDQSSPLYLGAMPLIAGERKAGKSILSLTITSNLCRAGKRGVYFSLEDPTANVIDRLTANLSGVPIVRHQTVGLNDSDLARLTTAAGIMAELPLSIYDDAHDLPKIEGIMRQQKAQYADLAFAVVDYAQLVSVKLEKGSNREQHVATVSRTLRRLSMELKIAVLVLCQLNKDGETRESKALEQDATAMWHISSPQEDKQTERWINIPWQRGGESQIACRVTFLGHLARFENSTDNDYADEQAPRQSNPPKRAK